MARAPIRSPSGALSRPESVRSVASIAALSLVANCLRTSRCGSGRESGSPESILRGVLDLCATAAPVSRSCQPGFFESRRRRTIHTAFNTGIAKRTRTIRSLSAIKPRPAGRPPALAMIRSPVSFRPGVVPDRRLTKKRNTSVAKPPQYMARAKTKEPFLPLRRLNAVVERNTNQSIASAAKPRPASAHGLGSSVVTCYRISTARVSVNPRSLEADCRVLATLGPHSENSDLPARGVDPFAAKLRNNAY